MSEITPELLLMGYAQGVFPMAQGAEAAGLEWYEPRLRGVIPLDGFHLSQSLAKRLRREAFELRVDDDFAGVVQACAARAETWINAELHALYGALFAMGAAHSLEVWQGGARVGALYGVALGGAFFGESMVSPARDGSKLALAYLVARLTAGGFTLLDTQFLTPHLASLGGIEISRARYRMQLATALKRKADFCGPATPSGAELVALLRQSSLQRETQIS